MLYTKVFRGIQLSPSFEACAEAVDGENRKKGKMMRINVLYGGYDYRLLNWRHAQTLGNVHGIPSQPRRSTSDTSEVNSRRSSNQTEMRPVLRHRSLAVGEHRVRNILRPVLLHLVVMEHLPRRELTQACQ